ncbi:MAG: tRNA dihydrouridine synthase DusB [Lachnospiraceae bacterium]|nr:tRNA dihydrouridine synthase DusB [Lachnospiraceae bacterium]
MTEQGFKIGSVFISGRVLLAPMANVTDMPFRLLCRKAGASMVCCEMVSAKAMYYKNVKTEELLLTSDRERPVSLQIFGSDPLSMGEAAAMLNDRPIDIVDINMGCPVPKVVKNGDGSALMRDPKLAGEVISAVVKRSEHPVTVKIRKGFDDDHVNAVEIAKIAETCGASAVAVHGRTREQYYEGKADWDIIAAVADALSIPVIGNGDVDSAEAALSMMEKTGVDAVMVGRAAKGNPWIFREIEAALRKDFLMHGDGDVGEQGCTSCRGSDMDIDWELSAEPDLSEIKKTVLTHAEMEVQLMGEARAIRYMRSHVMWYASRLSHSKRIRTAAGSIATMDDLKALVDTFEIR